MSKPQRSSPAPLPGAGTPAAVAGRAAAGAPVTILALDPGTTQSAYVLFGGRRVMEAAIVPNTRLIKILSEGQLPSGQLNCDILACEMIASYGMAVGREVFETCVWIGRFLQAHRGPHRLVYRKDVKLHLCNSPRAKDGNIRQALIDKYGPTGTKKNPGPLFGISSHAWAALAVADYAANVEAPNAA